MQLLCQKTLTIFFSLNNWKHFISLSGVLNVINIQVTFLFFIILFCIGLGCEFKDVTWNRADDKILHDLYLRIWENVYNTAVNKIWKEKETHIRVRSQFYEELRCVWICVYLNGLNEYRPECS